MNKVTYIQVNGEKFDSLLHELIKISNVIDIVTTENLSKGQNQILRGCQTRLIEVKQELTDSIISEKEK